MNLGTSKSNSKENCDSEDIWDDDSDDKVDGDGVAFATGVVEQRHKCSSKSNICALQCSAVLCALLLCCAKATSVLCSAPWVGAVQSSVWWEEVEWPPPLHGSQPTKPLSGAKANYLFNFLDFFPKTFDPVFHLVPPGGGPPPTESNSQSPATNFLPRYKIMHFPSWYKIWHTVW